MNAIARLAIGQLLEQTDRSRAAIDAFLADRKVPVVEGPSVTFLYRGEADAVFLRHWIFGLGSRQAFIRVDGSDLWYLVVDLPLDSRVEYKLEVVRGGTHDLIRDPLNPNLAHDPFGANSVAHGDGYTLPEWIQPDEEARRGELEERVFHSAALGDDRRVTLYLPARFRKTRRYPLVVTHDGGDFLRFAGLQTVLDNLIHRMEIPPLVAALTYPTDRMVEYIDHEPHARFLTEELVPWLESELPLVGTRSTRCLMGASLGAVAALSTAWRYPEVYGKLLLQSGSFAFTDIGENRRGPAFEPVVRFVNAYRNDPAKVADRVFVSCGTYESLIYENRSLVPLLQSTGMEIRYVEARDGHNWENWRDRLREGLSWLYPGPLWMVYE
jgi:enterochelin esterase family protein